MIFLRRIFIWVVAAGLCPCGPASWASEVPVVTGAMAPLESFSEVIERPLFAPDRKRPIKAAPALPAGQPVLTAIVLLKDKRYAVLREGDAPARRVNEGDSIGSATVRKILRDRIVTVAVDGTETTLRLFPEQPAETAKSAPQPVALPAPVITADRPEGPPTGMMPADSRPRKPLITSNP